MSMPPAADSDERHPADFAIDQHAQVQLAIDVGAGSST